MPDRLPFDLAATYVNRFEVHTYANGVTRIAFAFRDPSGGDNFLAAIVMADGDADELADTIKRLRAGSGADRAKDQHKDQDQHHKAKAT